VGKLSSDEFSSRLGGMVRQYPGPKDQLYNLMPFKNLFLMSSIFSRYHQHKSPEEDPREGVITHGCVPGKAEPRFKLEYDIKQKIRMSACNLQRIVLSKTGQSSTQLLPVVSAGVKLFPQTTKTPKALVINRTIT
jgi:hypothetical protein